VVRGIRLAVLALVADLGAVAVPTGHPGFLIVGALILAEELYETGVIALVVRAGAREPLSAG
jgi:hypothetical protein